MDSHANKDPKFYDNILQNILQNEDKKNRSNQLKLVGSWIVLLLALGLVFSGFEINLGFTKLEFIKLDPDFMKNFAPYIGEGILQTIAISIVSILFAMILALLSALARLSKVPIFVAISSFYVSLIRGTPLYLQVIFFFLSRAPDEGHEVFGIVVHIIRHGTFSSFCASIGIRQEPCPPIIFPPLLENTSSDDPANQRLVVASTSPIPS